jgi:DNA-binding response OmpR family regulator
MVGSLPVYLTGMGTNNTLLCIHREPGQLGLLQKHGYELVTATNGHDGLRLLGSRPVDAIVLDYHLGFLQGTVVAAEIKQAKPQIPIVMLAEDIDLPSDALNSVDALVTKSDGPHFLLATLHFVLNVKPAQRHEGRLRVQAAAHLRRAGRRREGANCWQADIPQLATDEKDAPFSPRMWRMITTGNVQF